MALELSALLWSDIDFDRRVIHIRRSQVGGDPTKTRSYRTVPVHPVVAALLVEQRSRLATRTVKPVHAEMVFPSTSGTYRTAAMLKKPLARCAARAGIDKHVTAHTMRRTFNNLARLAAGEIVARALTGHATSAMTEHYSHVSQDEKHKALDAVLGSLPGWGSSRIRAQPQHDPSSSPKKNPRSSRGFPSGAATGI